MEDGGERLEKQVGRNRRGEPASCFRNYYMLRVNNSSYVGQRLEASDY